MSNLLQVYESGVEEPENAMADKVHHDELDLLHEVCDGDIALHSVELAIQVCCDLTYQSRPQVLGPHREIIADKSQRQIIPSDLHDQGFELRMPFENLGHISDLEKDIAKQRKAIIYTPRHSTDRPLMLSNLGNSYLCRYDRFGYVKDMDSAIRLQLKAIASILRDSTLRLDLQSFPAWGLHMLADLNDLGRGRTLTMPSTRF